MAAQSSPGSGHGSEQAQSFQGSHDGGSRSRAGSIEGTMSSRRLSVLSAALGSEEKPSSASLSSPVNSLAAAAAFNAGLQTEERRRRSSGSGSTGQTTSTMPRRRSSIRMSLSLNDPGLPAPGEVANSPGFRARLPSTSTDSPFRHARAPSLGELHQELENEQEAHVNRLLAMIRQQQAHIQALQAHSQPPATGNNNNNTITIGTASNAASSLPAVEGGNPPSETCPSPSHMPSRSSSQLIQSTGTRIPTSRQHSFSSQQQQQQQQHISHSPSPSLRAQQTPLSVSPRISTHHGSSMVTDDYATFGGLASAAISPAGLRDESAFYIAETQSLTRENQMLKQRIRELERQLDSDNHEHDGTSHVPATHSSLHMAMSAT